MMNGGAPAMLLAKQTMRGRAAVSLLQHGLDTERAVRLLFAPEHRWGRAFGRFFRLDEGARKAFLLHARVAALLHDVGKANGDFQAAVRHSLSGAQTLRHEHLSAWLLHLPEVRAWLSTNAELDAPIITAAVLSHHFKASADGDWRWGQPRDRLSVALLFDAPDVRELLRQVATIAGLSTPPRITEQTWAPRSPWLEARREGERAARALRRDMRGDPRRRALLLATKTALVVADSTASGLVREAHPVAEWIGELVASKALDAADVVDSILDPRAGEVARRTGREFVYHTFQVRAAEQGRRALLLAACGAGKTLAAWKWAETRAREEEIGKVVFLYPTRATATEGFRDYVAWSPEGEGILLHGTARYELEAMMTNPSEAMRDKSFATDEGGERLFALGLWHYRYFSATVDQFLSFLEHGYGSTCLVPVLADAAVVIDEVHSFDRRMFGDLVAFLETFDVPVLCMTATLPASRRADLERAGLVVYPTALDRHELEDLEAKECHPRYRLQWARDPEDAPARVVEAYREGGKVLWVVNQVRRAQALAASLARDIGTEVICYHSAFRLIDRQRVHAAAVEAFRPGVRAVIAVTTQVCEMSLDLDADLLVTELAPVTALVQRFGRANRHEHTRDPSFRAALIVLEPENPRPYHREELAAARQFLAELRGRREISQRDLAEALERHAPGEPESDASARLLEGGYFATPGALRDADGYTVPCVLDSDLEDAAARHRARKPLDALVVPTPRKLVVATADRPAWLPRHLEIAPGARYSTHRGLLVEEGQNG